MAGFWDAFLGQSEKEKALSLLEDPFYSGGLGIRKMDVPVIGKGFLGGFLPQIAAGFAGGSAMGIGKANEEERMRGLMSDFSGIPLDKDYQSQIDYMATKPSLKNYGPIMLAREMERKDKETALVDAIAQLKAKEQAKLDISTSPEALDALKKKEQVKQEVKIPEPAEVALPAQKAVAAATVATTRLEPIIQQVRAVEKQIKEEFKGQNIKALSWLEIKRRLPVNTLKLLDETLNNESLISAADIQGKQVNELEMKAIRDYMMSGNAMTLGELSKRIEAMQDRTIRTAKAWLDMQESFEPKKKHAMAIKKTLLDSMPGTTRLRYGSLFGEGAGGAAPTPPPGYELTGTMDASGNYGIRKVR